ncbi:PsbP [Desulfosporosinus acidiphilus SJ4]|uniref:PsbP n=1 Tax=Desulfosporosinus acidiphilus (strain DSM 22704 / JCM 16185 / SJ4) TaxID=646529 RepID=I4DB82_DESAJ|nr:PsbP-related protein [Desulfosporosinus acidiphilus]AFM43056.1 PsbP [Desulfosporosinus acidiphilus SJ4]
MSKSIGLVIVVTTISMTALLGGCGTNSSPAPHMAPKAMSSANNIGTTQPSQTAAVTGSSSEKAVAPEKNPTGDIPDTQAFVNYTSASGGYDLVVPEGWGRTIKGSDVIFQDKLNGVQVAVSQVSSQPTVTSANKNQAAELQKTGRAVTIKRVKQVNLSGGQAVLIAYDSNSVPDPVTGKQVRLENNRYLFYKNGKLATLTLWAPLGADNVDQWNRMSASFTWR